MKAFWTTLGLIAAAVAVVFAWTFIVSVIVASAIVFLVFGLVIHLIGGRPIVITKTIGEDKYIIGYVKYFRFYRYAERRWCGVADKR